MSHIQGSEDKNKGTKVRGLRKYLKEMGGWGERARSFITCIVTLYTRLSAFISSPQQTSHTHLKASSPLFLHYPLSPLQDTVHYLAPLEPEILRPIHIHSLTLFFMQNADSINKQSALLLRANREDDSRLLCADRQTSKMQEGAKQLFKEVTEAE